MSYQDELNRINGTSGLSVRECLLTLSGTPDRNISTTEATNLYAGLSLGTNADQSQANITGNLGVGTVALVKTAQQFVPTKPIHTGVTVRCGILNGTYTGNVTFTLETDNSNSPSGIVIATATISNAVWAALTPQVTDININLPAFLKTDGTKYWYVVTSSTTDDANFTGIAGSTGNPYASGLHKTFNGSVWSADTGLDFYFKSLFASSIVTAQEAINLKAGRNLATQELLSKQDAAKLI